GCPPPSRLPRCAKSPTEWWWALPWCAACWRAVGRRVRPPSSPPCVGHSTPVDGFVGTRGRPAPEADPAPARPPEGQPPVSQRSAPVGPHQPVDRPEERPATLALAVVLQSSPNQLPALLQVAEGDGVGLVGEPQWRPIAVEVDGCRQHIEADVAFT